MAASAPQHLVPPANVELGMWGIWSGRQVRTEGVLNEVAAFYEAAAFYKYSEPHAALGGGIELIEVEPCVDMVRHTIEIYEASLDPRFAMLRLLALQGMLGQVLGHLSRTVSRLGRQLIPSLDARPGFSPAEWITKSMELYQAGKKEESLDVIFDTIDEMLLASKFNECDRGLSEIPVEEISNAQLLTVLTATIAAKERLSNRNELVRRVRLELERRGADAFRLLSGLE
jgi:hypothetical protein